MSILQDLDPKYAKMQTQRSAPGWKSMALLVMLAVATLGAGWLFISRIDHHQPEAIAMQEQTAKSQLAQYAGQKKSTIPPMPHLNPAEAKVGQNAAMPGGKIADAATIRNIDVNEAPSPQNSSSRSGISKNIVKKTDKPEVLAVSNSRSASPGATKIAELPPTSRATKPKLAKRKETHALPTVDSARPPMASKKAAERDVDIISAIVRYY